MFEYLYVAHASDIKTSYEMSSDLGIIINEVKKFMGVSNPNNSYDVLTAAGILWVTFENNEYSAYKYSFLSLEDQNYIGGHLKAIQEKVDYWYSSMEKLKFEMSVNTDNGHSVFADEYDHIARSIGSTIGTVDLELASDIINQRIPVANAISEKTVNFVINKLELIIKRLQN